jgi:hypothetical protein
LRYNWYTINTCILNYTIWSILICLRMWHLTSYDWFLPSRLPQPQTMQLLMIFLILYISKMHFVLISKLSHMEWTCFHSLSIIILRCIHVVAFHINQNFQSSVFTQYKEKHYHRNVNGTFSQKSQKNPKLRKIQIFINKSMDK